MIPLQEMMEKEEEARRRGYISDVSFLVDKKLKKKDYVEVWPGVGWWRRRMPEVVK